MIGKNMKVGGMVFALALGGGVLAGSVLGVPGISSAASSAATAPVTADSATTARPVPGTPPPVNLETALEGDVAAQVTAAAQAAVPDGTVDRVETDSDGSPYEAHVTKADGTHVVVKVDASFAVTGIEDMPAGGPHEGPPHADQAPAGQSVATAATAS